MYIPSGIAVFFQTCTVLTYAFAFETSQLPSHLATITTPPSTATIRARTNFGVVVGGPCGPSDRYVTVAAGASCQSVASENDITMDELFLMNPDLSTNCENLIAGKPYCVGIAGNDPPPASIFSCQLTADLCSCNDGLFYSRPVLPNPGGACILDENSLPSSVPPPPTSTSTTSVPPPAPKTTPPPPPPPSPSLVWKNACTTTPSTCFAGATGTDKVAYTTGCCNGCGPGGSCDLSGPVKGPMTWECACGGVYRREAFNGLIENGTWTA